MMTPDAGFGEVRNIPPELAEIFTETEPLVFVLRSSREGGHVPTTLVYRSLFEIEEKTDVLVGFDPRQDKIDIRELFLSFGGDMSLDNIKARVTSSGDLQLIINDGPMGVDGANYHFLTIQAFQNHKHPPLSKTLAGFIVL